MIRRIVIVLCLLVSAPLVHAQLQEEYRFKGIVVDGNGMPISTVRITLRDVATGARIEFTSKVDGTFDRRMIPHARYEAFFEKAGFTTYTQEFDWSTSPRQIETVDPGGCVTKTIAPERAIGCGNGEQAGLGNDRHPIARRPRRPGQGIERRGGVDQHEVVVGLDVGERLLELPDVPDAGVRPVEVDGGRAPDHHVDLAGAAARPAARGDRGADDLLLGGGEDVGDVEMTGDADVETRRDIRLRVEIDDEGSQSAGEGSGGQAERHGGLPHSSLEGADAKNMHE